MKCDGNEMLTFPITAVTHSDASWRKSKAQAGYWMRGQVASWQQTDSILYWSNKCSAGTLFTSEPCNRSQGGGSEVDWCLASPDSVSFTRSLSIAVTSYKRHFCSLDCTGEPVGLYTNAWWVKYNANNSHWAYTRVYSMYFHCDKNTVKKKKTGIECRYRGKWTNGDG